MIFCDYLPEPSKFELERLRELENETITAWLDNNNDSAHMKTVLRRLLDYGSLDR